MESLSCGTPVVAFNIGGNSDLIDHQKNGFLAIPFDIDSLTEGIIWCLSNNTNNNLSLMARQKVLNKFSINKIVNQHIDLYKSLIENY
jgi:glycosyltransferase involved in cell wall biosynthesis